LSASGTFGGFLDLGCENDTQKFFYIVEMTLYENHIFDVVKEKHVPFCKTLAR